MEHLYLILKIAVNKAPFVFHCRLLLMPVDMIELLPDSVFKAERDHPVVGHIYTDASQTIVGQEIIFGYIILLLHHSENFEDILIFVGCRVIGRRKWSMAVGLASERLAAGKDISATGTASMGDGRMEEVVAVE